MNRRPDGQHSDARGSVDTPSSEDEGADVLVLQQNQAITRECQMLATAPTFPSACLNIRKLHNFTKYRVNHDLHFVM